MYQWFKQCQIDNKVPFWELLSVIGARFNFDGEADLEIVEDAPNDDEDDDDHSSESETEAELEHKCLVCGRYFESDFLIDKGCVLKCPDPDYLLLNDLLNSTNDILNRSFSQHLEICKTPSS